MSDEGRLVAGRYRLAERIGRGGMGTVWRAEDEVLGRQVALKRLHSQPHLAEDELATLYERTRREARSAARITHPNVIVVHDVVDDDGRPCIVMEYVAPPTLSELLKGGRTIGPEEAGRIGLGMVAALRAAHAAGVLHRDVKPGNVLLGTGERVVLTDFGIAMTAGASTLTKTGELVGSIDYMAAERVRGRTPGAASDLWALGATLYQAVEGRPPFRRDTAMETAYAIAVDPPEPMKHAGPLEPVIGALLSKDPDDRPSADQIEQALRDARSGESTAGMSPAVTGATSPVERHSVAGPDPLQEPGSEARATSDGSAPPTVPVPPRTAAGRGRRRGRKRLLLASTAVTVTAAATAGALYAASHRNQGAPEARQSHHATPSSPAASPVPHGYHQVREEKIGASFPVPNGWKNSKRTAEQVTYINPVSHVELTIRTVAPAGPNPMSRIADQESNTKVNYPIYRRLRMTETTFRNQPAAVWEFAFRGKASYRAIELGFGHEGGREYDIYVSAPEGKWDTYRPVFDKVLDGFLPTAS
ncbi:serine/threonine protein kinase [Streptomyces kronopolitis]|uniref:non-specific serine/threonine protein kinase n=1 Tax=Streptomyces kronopolitis TaxID=1612435 RepID=A0ABQ2IX95_9ACTN|nr:serine/threonine-protein kinase [Streptomyces kronopolitis]GGN32598.1 serine/threonine protein kinase [Streptomyces kronopolitis]